MPADGTYCTSMPSAPLESAIRPSESRAHATHDHYEQEEPIQVSCTVAKHNPEQREEEYL